MRYPLILALTALLASCGGDERTASTPAPSMLASVVRAQTSKPASVTFTGNLSQYTVVDNGAGGFTVTDNVAQTSQTVPAGRRLFFADTAIALDLTGTAGQAYRLYQAAFNRKPDIGGLGFQIDAMEGLGFSLTAVSQNFIDSPEFQSTYGNVNTTQFVTLLYGNVLHRTPDADGLAFHVGLIDGTRPDHLTITRAADLKDFSESPENQANVLPDIRNGIEYTPSGFTPPSNPASDFAGTYTGSFRGGDSGTLSMVVTSTGAFTATAHATGLNADLTGSGTLQAGGKISATLTGGNRTMALSGSVRLAAGLATGTWTFSGTSTTGFFNATRPPVGPSFSQVQAIIQQRCLPCHSQHTTQPGFPFAQAGIMFDTEAQIRAQSGQIFTNAVETQNMPFGNQTHMTQAERDLLKSWFDAGQP